VSIYSRRRSALLPALDAFRVEGFLVTAPANVRYLSGFTGSNGWLLLTSSAAVFFTDPRYAEQAAMEVREAEQRVSSAGLAAALVEVVGRLGITDLGLEASQVTVSLWRKLEEITGVGWVALDDVVERVRRRKEGEEVEAIRTALKVAEAAMQEVAATITPGQTEFEVAAALEYACRRAGATHMAFDTIVAAGERSALPHGVASDRAIGAAEPVMIDMGCVVDGYCSDITRMVWVGDVPDDAWLRLYEVVDGARAAALAAIHPGKSAREVDAAAREVISAAGYGEGFSHGTGHGVGLQIHEAPALSARSEDLIEAGMVVTVEPAVYLSGRYGIRIEDLAVVREDGCERLTTLEPEPILRGIP
jgi:Xaa-Pro aminopeptidase